MSHSYTNALLARGQMVPRLSLSHTWTKWSLLVWRDSGIQALGAPSHKQTMDNDDDATPNGGVGGRCGSRGGASCSSNGCVSVPSRGGGGGGVGGGGHHRSLNSTVAAVIISHALLAVVPMAALEVAVVAVAMRRVCPIAASPCLPD